LIEIEAGLRIIHGILSMYYVDENNTSLLEAGFI